MRGCPTKKEGVREASGGLGALKLQEVQLVLLGVVKLCLRVVLQEEVLRPEEVVKLEE